MSAISQSQTETPTKNVSPLTGHEKVTLVISALAEQSQKAGYTMNIYQSPDGLIIQFPGLTVVNNEIVPR
jgi:hypothetical protein